MHTNAYLSCALCIGQWFWSGQEDYQKDMLICVVLHTFYDNKLYFYTSLLCG